MYLGKNKTALQSMDWISDALTKLMLSQPYSKISIRDICEASRLSRQTFYNLFDTKEEVMHYCLQKQYEKQLQRLPNDTSLTMNDIIETFIAFGEENHLLLDYMIDNHLDGIITKEIANCISIYVTRFVNTETDSELLPYSIALLSGALAQLQLYLFQQDQPLNREKLLNLLTDFFHGNIYHLP